MRTIVVAYDGSEPARRALVRTAELATAFRSEVIVTSIAPVLVAGPRGSGGVDPTSSSEAHETELREGVSLLAGRGVSAQAQRGVGDPASTIVEVAEARGADLIVIGTREPRTVERILQGSVSAAVSRRAHCDVLIVH
jgi:nucleotide-binding universal stress UspA family protein